MAKKFDLEAKWHAWEEKRDSQVRTYAGLKEEVKKMAAEEKKASDPEKSANAYRDHLKKLNDVLYSLGPFSGGVPAPPAPAPPSVLWDDIVGQHEAKAAVREAVEGMTKYAELYKRYGRRPPKGVLLYGPPGNGKTMLGKAAAGALGSNFTYVKGSDLLSKWLGETEGKIRQLFDNARHTKRTTGCPAVLFFDECEELFGHRDRSSVGRICVPAFLAEMDGLEESGAFVVLATNRHTSLDSAVIREGRIDRKILVGRPTLEDAAALFYRCLEGKPVEDQGELAARAANALFDGAKLLYRIQLEGDRLHNVTLGHLTSGAQIAYLVDAAASLAIEREISAGVAGRIEASDVEAAVERTLKEQRELDHPTELAALCEAQGLRPIGLERVRTDGRVAKKSLIAKVPRVVEEAIEFVRPVRNPEPVS